MCPPSPDTVPGRAGRAGRAEADRHEAEARLLELSADAIIMTDEAQVIQLFNRGAEAIFGYQADEVLGRPLDVLLPQPLVTAHRRHVRRFAAGGTAARHMGKRGAVIRGRRKDGEEFPADASISTETVDGRRLFAVTLRDISDQVAADQERASLLALYRDLFENAPVGFLSVGADGTILTANKRLEELLGATPGSLAGRRVFELYADLPGGRPVARKIFTRFVAGERVTAQEAQMVRADGTPVWVAVSMRPVYDAAGSVTASRSAVMDISRRRAAEASLGTRIDELDALNNAARTAVASLDLHEVAAVTLRAIVAGAAPDLAMCFLRRGERLELLATVSRTAGLRHQATPEHVVGECLCGLAAASGVAAYSRNIHADARCTWKECKEAGVRSFAALPLKGAEGTVGVLGLASASETDFEARATFLETLADQLAGGIQNALLHEAVKGHAAELERRVAERTAELQESTEKAQDADRLKSVFLATMSHELRTPLNSIIGFTGMLLQGLAGPLGDEQARQLGMVRRSANHLLELINDILDISKIEAGELEIRSAEFDLRAALDRVADTVAPAARGKGLALTTAIAADVGRITSDRRRVEQIVLNLLSNAVKFTDEGEVGLEASVVGGRAVINVTDTGIGIKDEELKNLFRPFQQVDTGLDRAFEGTGLGLSIAGRLATLLGGEIGVVSTWGAGSTFTVSLPTLREAG